MSNTPYHGKEISADTYAALTRHQFNLESLGDKLQRIENTTAAMKDKWRRGDEAMRDFIGHKKKQKEDPSRRLPSESTDANKSTSIDIALPVSNDINILTSVDIYSGLEPKLTSNTKSDTTACLGAWYTCDRILQTSLEGPDTCLKILESFDRYSQVPSILEIFGANIRDDHRDRLSVDIGELESINTQDMVSIDSEERRKPVWSQPT
ncbi:hypothetical protein DY000_02039484 [Brassica cretica]|uniref:Uncharacterized protein n=1 Tax=Brassica cretica TaxID=69181 RepID=A0ABQ7B575_BRACR|nr:hypothetical protein DY000_02039484 [Brassica cretica]